MARMVPEWKNMRGGVGRGGDSVVPEVAHLSTTTPARGKVMRRLAVSESNCVEIHAIFTFVIDYY